MVGEIDSVSQLPSDRSCIFRTTNSNWDGVLPSTYTPYARFRSSHSGAYSFWLGVDTEQKMWFARHLPNDGIPTISEWHEVAVAEPPQKFSIPLSEGWEAQSGGDAKYFKTQEDIVHVSMNVKSNTAVADGDTIATLPAGFRPASQLKIPIICKVSGQSALKFGHFDVTTNGAIRIYDAVTGSEIVTEIAVAPFTFDAAG